MSETAESVNTAECEAVTDTARFEPSSGLVAPGSRNGMHEPISAATVNPDTRREKLMPVLIDRPQRIPVARAVESATILPPAWAVTPLVARMGR